MSRVTADHTDTSFTFIFIKAALKITVTHSTCLMACGIVSGRNRSLHYDIMTALEDPKHIEVSWVPFKIAD